MAHDHDTASSTADIDPTSLPLPSDASGTQSETSTSTDNGSSHTSSPNAGSIPLPSSLPSTTSLTLDDKKEELKDEIESPSELEQSGNEEDEPGSDGADTAEEVIDGAKRESFLKEDGDEESGSDDSGSEQDSEEEEEEEPVLKYARLEGGASEVLLKDSASAIASSPRFIAIGTHVGMVHILSYTGQKLSSYRAHSASITDIRISDDGSEFVGTSSVDGKVVINSLLAQERYIHDFRRPIRTLALEPSFAKRSSKAFVCGGMAGSLSLMEKGWMGGLGAFGDVLGKGLGMAGGGNGQHKETVLHDGEGPIWKVEWNPEGLIAWANDLGVKLYDTTSQRLISFIDRPPSSPRADLFKPTITFITPSNPSDPTTLIIAWADYIKLARIRTRTSSTSSSRPSSIHHSSSSSPSLPSGSSTSLHVEITAIFQVDCMISGLLPYKNDFLVLAYLPPDEEAFYNEQTEDRDAQKRKAANRPELRIISRRGEELSSDALSGLKGYHLNGCNDYFLVPGTLGDGSGEGLGGDGEKEEMNEKDGGKRIPSKAAKGKGKEEAFLVLSPKDIVVARQRDVRDTIAWLVERKRYEEALDAAERLRDEGFDVREIGEKFLDSLVQQGQFEKAAALVPKVLGGHKKAWEDWIFLFVQKHQLPAIMPYVPMKDPQLSDMVYEMIIAHYLANDQKILLELLRTWPSSIYGVSNVVNAVEGALEQSPRDRSLMECLAELYIIKDQPGRALPYLLRLRRPDIFDFIRERNLFTDVRDQALLLVEFDMDINHSAASEEGQVPGGLAAEKPSLSKSISQASVSMTRRGTGRHGKAIELLVDHHHSIPVPRVLSQLSENPRYLFYYLDALFEKDPHLVADYGDQHIAMCAEFAYPRLMDLLRASIEYSLEKALNICKFRDYVPEQVFLLGRMGNNKAALMLIIQRLGDIERAIEFATEQNDADLWEDLLQYSENKPPFIRALLENVGAGIDPILLIRRIKDGLEIPGLKEALIKILQDYNLQISLLEGCQTILHSDCSSFTNELQKGQTQGFFAMPTTLCQVCSLPVFRRPSGPVSSQPVVCVFLCRHIVHSTCAVEDEHDLPEREISFRTNLLDAKADNGRMRRGMNSMGAKLSYAAALRVKIPRGCTVCRAKPDAIRA